MEACAHDLALGLFVTELALSSIRCLRLLPVLWFHAVLALSGSSRFVAHHRVARDHSLVSDWLRRTVVCLIDSSQFQAVLVDMVGWVESPMVHHLLDTGGRLPTSIYEVPTSSPTDQDSLS